MLQTPKPVSERSEAEKRHEDRIPGAEFSFAQVARRTDLARKHSMRVCRATLKPVEDEDGQQDRWEKKGVPP